VALHDVGQIAGRDAEFVGVEARATRGAVVLAQQYAFSAKNDAPCAAFRRSALRDA